MSRQGDMLVVHTMSGRAFSWHLGGSLGTVREDPSRALVEFCPTVDYVQGCVIAMSASGRLYCGDRQMLTSASSFKVHSNFLLAASVSDHQLVCIPLSKLECYSSDVCTKRRIERGARIIHAVAAATAVVLQMPRGNLEVVHPRALTLDIVKCCIDG